LAGCGDVAELQADHAKSGGAGQGDDDVLEQIWYAHAGDDLDGCGEQDRDSRKPNRSTGRVTANAPMKPNIWNDAADSAARWTGCRCW
jgi:hypothetical protein